MIEEGKRTFHGNAGYKLGITFSPGMPPATSRSFETLSTPEEPIVHAGYTEKPLEMAFVISLNIYTHSAHPCVFSAELSPCFAPEVEKLE
jgi:hypothetical protein